MRPSASQPNFSKDFKMKQVYDERERDILYGDDKNLYGTVCEPEVLPQTTV